MRSPTRLMRLGVLLATTSLTMAAILPAAAQPAAPAGAEQAGNPNAEPPALAGRVAAITGTVSFHAAGETQWSAATLNYPVTNGGAYWTEPQAQTTLEIADDRLVLDSSTELDVGAIDTSQIVLTEAQGAIFLHLNSLQPNQTVTINTPRGAVQLTQAGRYEIVAGDTNDATTITVVEGAAHITGTNLTLDVGPQQTATIGGSDTLQGSVGPMQQDAFLQSMLRVPARRHFAPAVPAQVQYMTGSSDLETYGSFTQTAQYGQVWYPTTVARSWAPYRDGHWSYVQPWGWTWVDNARWGFAPFHYGRWVQVNERWGWVPGGGEVSVGYNVSPYPVYSPALVSFVDVGGVALGASIGFSAGYAPAWIPLGPREPYYPWYHARGDYFARINAPYGVPRTIIERGPTYINTVRNSTVINNTTINNTTFINQRAATVVPAAAFTRGQSLVAVARPVPVAALAHARPFVGRLAVAPTAETPNLSPAIARRYNVSLPARPVRPALAGPRIQAAEGAQPRAVPQLRQAAPPPGVRSVPAASVHTGQVAAPGVQPRVQPAPAALPGLREKGARPGQPAPIPPARQPAAIRPEARVPAPAPVAPAQPPAIHERPGLPPLRAPGGARPEPTPRPNEVNRPAKPAPIAQPGHQPGALAGPEAPRPGVPAQAPRPEPRPAAPTPAATPGCPSRTGTTPRGTTPRTTPRTTRRATPPSPAC